MAVAPVKVTRVMIAGAGGNSSWFIRFIDDLIVKQQIPDTVEFTIFDEDEVEKKNLLYQAFETGDILKAKSKVLGIRYGMAYKEKYIVDPKEFDAYDVVVAGVDNKDFRVLLYEYMDKHPEKYWIDMRAEGRVATFYTAHKKNTLKYLMGTLPAQNAAPTSCQLKYELESGIIQLGNRIIAMIGAQLLLNYIRGEANQAEFTHMF